MNEPFRYEVDAAGQRFLMMREVAAQNPHTAITVVQNWFAEFKKKK